MYYDDLVNRYREVTEEIHTHQSEILRLKTERVELMVRLRRTHLTDRQLADRLGISQARVAQLGRHPRGSQ